MTGHGVAKNRKPTYETLERRITFLEEKVRQGRQVENTIHESREKFRALADSTPIAVMLYQDNRFISVNKAAETISGYSIKELLGMNFWDIVHRDYRTFVQEYGSKRQDGEKTKNRYEIKINTKEGMEKWVDVVGVSTMIKGRPAGLISVIDITDRKLAEDALKKTEELHTRLVNTIPDIIIRTDIGGKILFANDYALQVSGYCREELEQQNILIFISPEDRNRAMQDITLMLEGRLGPREYHLIMKDGRKILFEINGDVLRNGDSMPIGLVYACRDITDRKQAEEKLKYLSIHDSLTGLYNRFFFEEELRRLSKGRYDPVGIVMCDLDGLKLVNDNLGHNVGDRQLITTANLLKEQFRSSDIVARIGGDEFAVLLPDCSSETIRDICTRLKQAMMDVYIPDTKIPLMVSIGYTVRNTKECPIEELIKEADAKMYQNKKGNRRVFQERFFHIIPKSSEKSRTRKTNNPSVKVRSVA